MRRVIVPATLIAAIAAGSSAASDRDMGVFRGIRSAERTLISKQGEVTRRCQVFPGFVAIELDSGQVGDDEILLRKRGKSERLEALCAGAEGPGDLKLPQEEQYVEGAVGGYLFTTSADGAGESGGLWIYDTATGKRLYEADYHLHRPFVARLQGSKLSVTYYARLKLKCSLAHETKKCWEATLKENGVPASVTIAAPDCGSVYASPDFKKYPELSAAPDAIQVFVQARVSDVRAPGLEYLGGRAICNASP